ncbi:MAG TPA: Lrp/AsnC ligand binding domain-containing protein [Bryobacteraceae bacterium]|nr:Lrp/AsnC ligand binding domain-containing protein [Bryobacteraceae bacterium]
MITAIVLVNTTQGRTPEVAEALLELSGVTEAYSVAGSYDLVVMVRVEHHEDLADVVAGRIQKTPGIEATNTLIAFQAYGRRQIEAGFAIGNEESLRQKP